jgi:ankyrin repeat protein
MVLLLLQRPDISLDIQDFHGRTPLAVAAQNDSAIIVDSLLQRSTAELNIPDFEGKTPLARASENGGFNTVELLRKRMLS